MSNRRQRIHELVLALLARQSEAGLLDEEPGLRGGSLQEGGGNSGWLERNRQQVRRYQALVRTAVTIDTLIEQEMASEIGRAHV